VADALRQAGTRPIMIAPGCTFDPMRGAGGEFAGARPGRGAIIVNGFGGMRRKAWPMRRGTGYEGSAAAGASGHIAPRAG